MIRSFIDFLENPIFSLRASENLSHRATIFAAASAAIIIHNLQTAMTRGRSRCLHQDRDGCTHARRHGFKLQLNISPQWENCWVQPVYADAQGCIRTRHLHLSSRLPSASACSPLSRGLGLHHGEGAKDETKHDSVWQPLSGSALIHGNPAVSGELRERGRDGGRRKERPRQGGEGNKGGELGTTGLVLLYLICAGKEKKKKSAAGKAELRFH